MNMPARAIHGKGGWGCRDTRDAVTTSCSLVVHRDNAPRIVTMRGQLLTVQSVPDRGLSQGLLNGRAFARRPCSGMETVESLFARIEVLSLGVACDAAV